MRPRPHPRHLFAWIAALAVCVLPGIAAAQVARNVTLLSHPAPAWAQYAACWSYVHEDGREYAAIGTNVGTAIYRLTDPANPVLVGHVGGPTSQWREMKQYRDWLYVVSEGAGTGAGLQIIRMTNPDAPVLAATYTATFLTAHTVTIDTTRALLYANGTRLAGGTANGVRILSLANPESPVEVGAYTGPYVHDSHVRDGLLYTAHINEGRVRVLDVNDPALADQPSSRLAETTFGNPFPHNTWTSPDKKYLYVTNENSEGLMKTFDISDLGQFRQTAVYKAAPNAICHNVHNRGDTLFASHYTEGVRLLDIADPARPAEWGYYDTYTGTGVGFFGNWEVCAEYPSGIFIASDIQTGLYVLRAVPDYGIVAGKVVDRTGAPVPDVTLHLHAGASGGSLTSQGATSDAGGRFRVALDPGAYTFEAHKFGYGDGSAGGTMAAGATDSVVIVLERIPFAAVTGTVTAGAASAFGAAGFALDTADLHLDATPLDTVAVAGGGYRIGEIPNGVWRLHAAHPAYIPQERSIGILGGVDEVQDFALDPVVLYDACEVVGAWSTFTAGDNATTVGRWANGDPNGTGAQSARAGGGTTTLLSAGPMPAPGPELHHPDHDAENVAGPGPVSPEDDHSPGARTRCFVTGLGAPGAGIGDHDVDGGRTTLTSPLFDLAGVSDPTLAWYQWYVNDGNSNVDDALVIQVSNDGGTSWVHVDSLRASTTGWARRELRVADRVAPTATMRLRFIAADTGAGSVVEAGLDDLAYYGAPATVDGPATPHAALLAFAGLAPNPAAGAVRMTLAGPEGATVDVTVHDVRGRLVQRLAGVRMAGGVAAITWNGRDRAGRMLPAGVYLVRATADGRSATARMVRLAAAER